ncbi:MAG: hypothetical protein R2734_01305 [Nocardioides sp.]
MTTVTSSADVPAMTALGAHAVSRDDEVALAGLGGSDVVFDVAGEPEQIAQRQGWVTSQGRYLSVTVRGDGIEMVQVQWDAAALGGFLAGVADGTFSVIPAQLYALEDVAPALSDHCAHARTALDFRRGR